MQESTEFWGPGPFLGTNTFAESVMCQQATAHFFLYQLWKTVSDLIYLFIIGCEMLFKILLKSKIWKEKKKWSTSEPSSSTVWERHLGGYCKYFIAIFIHSSFKGIGFNYVFTFSEFSSCQCSSEHVCWQECFQSDRPHRKHRGTVRKCLPYIWCEYSE